MPIPRGRGPGRPFKPGEGGRPKGRKNDRTIVREYIGLGKAATLDLFENGSAELGLPPRHERLAKLLQRAPAPVAAGLERDLLQHGWGRPKETVELMGKLDVGSAIVEAFRRVRRERDGGEDHGQGGEGE